MDEQSGKAWTDKVFTSINVLTMIAALCAIIIAWQWFDTRNQINKLQLELASRLAAAESYNHESRQRAAQALEAERASDVRIGILERKMADSQNQQVALEQMYQELARSRDESALAEVEQVLLIANQQLQLAGNVRAALIALQNVDNTLQRMDRPQLRPLRKVINRDIDRLKSMPFADVVGESLHLDNVLNLVDAMPLAMEAHPHPAPGKTGKKEGSVWLAFGREAWEDVKQLVKIQNMGKEEMPLLPPSQAYFLRENLKLRLLSARLSLLAHDQGAFREDLKTAQDWIRRYFDVNSAEAKESLSTLHQIYGSEINLDRMDINDSLNAIHDFRGSVK
ncbi:MAG: uroporphyrinogen-III C-methyltransferase [Burkholderiales bacterium]|nr:uroporphyrinogen-III C-methyltransferase [Burkholderiales bacterium]